MDKTSNAVEQGKCMKGSMAESAPKKATEEDVAVGGRIATLRIASGLSQTALGQAVGVSFQQVQKYEAGRNRVGAGRLQAIADALGVPVSTLFGQVGAPGGDESVTLPSLKVEGAAAMVRAYASIKDAGMRRDLLAIVLTAAKMAKDLGAEAKDEVETARA